MAKLHKIEFYLVDYDGYTSKEDIFERIEREFEIDGGIMQSNYGNVEIGDWHDDHKFNFWSTSLDEYEKEFENLK